MRVLESAGLGVLALALASASVAAQEKAANPPMATTCPEAVSAIATCYRTKLETGAYLLAAMPKTWNGNLIVFAHGGPSVTAPVENDSDDDLVKYSIGVRMGFAWIASTYRKEGYGVKMAAADTEDARKFFVERIAKPKRTILHGASYGGMVGSKMLETYAANYDGALFNSGAVSGSIGNYEFRADLRAVYQYYCNNFPAPSDTQYPLWAGLPAESKLTLKELTERIDACTGATKPAEARSETQKKNLANILGVMRIPETMLVRHMQAGAFVFRDIGERITNGKNPFSNTSVRYWGSSDDAALNRGIMRFEADTAARTALIADGQATGAITVPVVSIHSMNDPQAAVEAQWEYRDRVRSAGKGNLLVQAYTDERVHVGQSPPEFAASFEALMQWVEKGTKPTAQSIAAACAPLRATYEGPCRYHPEYEPKPLNTRYARSAPVTR
jgi:pimeloyl-ACP methyl ester carboxylesterase